MPKLQRRKPPRRKQPITKIEPELAELALVLDEQRMEQNIEGWLALPWRDGRNAAWLAMDACNNELDLYGDAAELDAFLHIYNSARTRFNRLRPSLIYDEAEEIWIQACEAPLSSIALKGIRAMYRCYQLWISKSDGGGHGYNTILRRDVADMLTSELVLKHRCLDAIGVESNLRNDFLDRKRGAFRVAWERGLFRVAYAL